MFDIIVKILSRTVGEVALLGIFSVHVITINSETKCQLKCQEITPQLRNMNKKYCAISTVYVMLLIAILIRVIGTYVFNIALYRTLN